MQLFPEVLLYKNKTANSPYKIFFFFNIFEGFFCINHSLMYTKIQYINLLKAIVQLFPEVLLYTNNTNTINLTYKTFFFFNIFEGLFCITHSLMQTKIQYINLLKVLMQFFPEVLHYTNNTINSLYKLFLQNLEKDSTHFNSVKPH